MTAIVTAIIAVAKAIPILSQYLNAIVIEWQKWQISQIDNSEEAKRKRLNFLTFQFKNARNDEERIKAFHLLKSVD